MYNDNLDIENNRNSFKLEIIRYFNFWPWFTLSVIIFVLSSYFYLRYADYYYRTQASIQIVDEAQDREMALPTSVTVFNRSMINLQNEINIFLSYSIHRQVVKELKSNVQYFTSGNIKTSENHSNKWYNDYELDFKIDTEKVDNILKFEIEIIDESKINIFSYKNSDLIKTYKFKTLSTKQISHDLPFELTINQLQSNETRTLKILPIESVINKFKSNTKVIPLGNESDQLLLTFEYPNYTISENYLNTLLMAFDKDGIKDRQLEYKNTIDFVNKRSEILRNELEKIELKKQNFKQVNNLTDLRSDANLNIQEKYVYDSELFETESQKTLATYLLSSIDDNEFDYLPLNIGLENFDLNLIISEYNLLVRERYKYLSEAGPNNYFIKSTEKQITKYSENIKNSIRTYLNSIELKINNLTEKEKEFEKIYGSVPENEKILRTIDRELTVKEALFLLLLQKREEAAINFAVVKPTIKIIDYALTNNHPTYPNKRTVYLGSIIFGLFLPFIFLYLRFFFDNKIHTKDQFLNEIGDSIPLIGEIPFIKNSDELNKISKSDSRTILSESIRMIIANLSFTFLEKQKSKVILVTSTIKGEGKTLVSINIASVLNAKNKKTLIIGADLRNPQIHKLFNVKRSILGLSDMIHKKDVKNYKNYLLKKNNLDIIFSGTIPPNPTELLASNYFSDFINQARNEYEHIVIDSAPCLLVSDTLEISKYVDSTIYVFRANYSDKNLCKFIIDNIEKNRLKNVNLVINAVGNSHSYGYRYGYQYGYNYGYGYGYD